MGRIQRTLGPVGLPVDGDDIASKAYVDSHLGIAPITYWGWQADFNADPQFGVRYIYPHDDPSNTNQWGNLHWSTQSDRPTYFGFRVMRSRLYRYGMWLSPFPPSEGYNLDWNDVTPGGWQPVLTDAQWNRWHTIDTTTFPFRNIAWRLRIQSESDFTGSDIVFCAQVQIDYSYPPSDIRLAGQRNPAKRIITLLREKLSRRREWLSSER